MYYRFNAVRTIETKDGSKNIKITLFSTSEPDKVKDVLRENEILVMSFEKVDQPLGILYEFGIKSKEGDIVPIILTIDGKIRDAFKKFIDEFGIVDKLEYVKPVGKDLPEEKLKIVLNKLKEENGLISKEADSLNQQKTKKLSDKDKKQLNTVYEELKEEIESFIKEMEELIPYSVNQFPVETKKLQDLIGQLKKYRISTNIYKLSEVFSKALEVGHDLEQKYLDFLQIQDKDNFSVSLISEIEVLKEMKKYKKIKTREILSEVDKEFKLQSYELILYQLLGKFAPHLLLLLKEQKRKLEIKGLNYFVIMDFFIYIFLFVILNYSILILFTKLNIVSIDLINIFFSLVVVSYFGFLFALAKLIGYKNKFLGIILILLGILLRKPIKLYFGF